MSKWQGSSLHSYHEHLASPMFSHAFGLTTVEQTMSLRSSTDLLLDSVGHSSMLLPRRTLANNRRRP